MKQGDLFADPAANERSSDEPGAEPPAPALPKTASVARAPKRPRPLPHKAIADADDRARAVTVFDRPVLLEAGAGTGKTATLVARVLSWCLGSGWEEEAASGERGPEDIALAVLRGVAAITFTEAAAAEMSTRVGTALARVQRVADVCAGGEIASAAGELPIGLALDQLPPAAAELSVRARALRAALDQLAVSTIHAFCRRLLATYPLEASFAPLFEVDAAGSRTATIVREVLEDYVRDAWADPIDEDLLALAKRRKAPPEIEAAIHKLMDDGARAVDFEVDPLAGDMLAEMLERFTLRATRVLEAGGEPLSTVPGTQQTGDALDALRTSLAEIELAGSPAELDARATNELFAKLAATWTTRAKKKLSNWRDELTKTEQKKLGNDHAKFLVLVQELAAAAQPVIMLDPAFLGSARRVLHAVLERVEAEMRRRGVATFNDLLRGARDLLVRHPEIARRERRRMRQLLVDEFQDTDGVQCDIVRALTLGAEEGERAPCLFLVGDPKQSIFAWRNADLAAYDAFKHDVKNTGGDVLELTENFRSVPDVLAEVERVIAPVMRRVEGVQPDFVPLNAYRGARDDPAPVIEYWASWPADPVDGTIRTKLGNAQGASYDAEAQALARDILAQHGADGMQWKDVCVIFRALTDVERYLRELREQGIPYAVQSERKYYQRREIVDATALVRAVLDPNDLLALVTLLRSPMVGLPDAALLPLWNDSFPARVAELRRPDDEQLSELDALVRRAGRTLDRDVPGLEELGDWETSVVGAVRAIAIARDAYGRLSIDRWLETLRALFLPDATEGARFLGEYRLANLERFFRELQRTLEERDGDTQSILRTLRANLSRDDKTEAGRPSDSGHDAVQILTIHGAKGLEFRHVYLAQMHKREAPGDRDGDTSFSARGGLSAYRLFGATSPAYFEAEDLARQAERAERIRLLYVAMTRACDRLVLLSGWKTELDPDIDAIGRLSDALEHRRDAQAAVLALARNAGNHDATPVVDAASPKVAWRLATTVEVDATARRSTSARAALTPIDRVRTDSRVLAKHRAHAVAHRARPYHGQASSAAADDRAHESVELAERAFADVGMEIGAEAARTAPLKRDAAMLAGTLVHRMLETFDFSAEPAEAREHQARALDAELAALDDADLATDLRTRCFDVLDRMESNGLLDRLRGLAAHVVARELPLLTGPPSPSAAATDEGRPVAFVSGAIDLVYRDPESGELVVADYKTDVVQDAADLRERTSHYRAQGSAYVESVRAALELDTAPRFELWFLYGGEVVALEGTQ